ncbi:MAG: hypothetical protein Q9213_004926 [Squamulea squamosa]
MFSDTSQLPLSPLLDPDLLAARNRYKVPKLEPGGELSAFQKKLHKNPYAQALATPVRQCAVTGSRLPKFFLLDFGFSPHPKTGEPWQMPKLAITTNAGNSSHASTVETTEENQIISDPAIVAADTIQRSARTAAGSHIIAQQSALRMVSTLKHKSYMQIIPQRWKLDARFKADQIVWRKDMDTFILDLMQRVVTKTLRYLSSQPAAYIVPCQDYESIQDRHQPGAVLWLGQDEGNETAMLSKEDPPPYAMVEYRSSGYIPLYNLPTLLGPEYMYQLRDTIESFRGTLAVIKGKRNTTGCQMQLWKLMGYMATDTSGG